MYHYYLFHKPFGCVTARRDVRYPTVMDWFSALDNPDLSRWGGWIGRPRGFCSSPTTECSIGS